MKPGRPAGRPGQVFLFQGRTSASRRVHVIRANPLYSHRYQTLNHLLCKVASPSRHRLIPAAGFLPLPTSREAHRPRPAISEEAAAVVVVSVRRSSGVFPWGERLPPHEKYRPDLVRAMKENRILSSIPTSVSFGTRRRIPRARIRRARRDPRPRRPDRCPVRRHRRPWPASAPIPRCR